MFSTLRSRLLLAVYIFIVLSVPVGAYLVSQNQTVKSKASEPIVKNTPKPTNSAAKELLSTSESNLPSLDTAPESTTDTSSPTIATSFGPTLSLKAILEGRPQSNQKTTLFVGILEGGLTANPKFILSFNINLPESGSYDNLSLAGLTSGNTYTALLKGDTQIATASAFVMSPAVTTLNNGDPLTLLSGDLNQDNVINDLDFGIIQKAFGSRSTSSNWNESADFNLDGVVNSFDLAIVTRNQGQNGASGIWTSPIPATSSASLSPDSTKAVGSPGGYWLWVPQ